MTAPPRAIVVITVMSRLKPNTVVFFVQQSSQAWEHPTQGNEQPERLAMCQHECR